MFALSSIHSAVHQPEDDKTFPAIPEPSSSSSSFSWRPAAEEDDASVYHDVLSDCSEDHTSDEDRESVGGTIIASLSSKEVLRNIEFSRFDARPLAGPSSAWKTHPVEVSEAPLEEVATIKSDTLSFTPTMAELALSAQIPAQQHTPRNSAVPATTKASSHHHPTPSEAFAVSTLGISDVQPDRVACPFCDREKDLQWRLTREEQKSQDLTLSGYRARFVFIATIVTVLVAIFSFILGKLVSDFQSEKVIKQYMAQCNAMRTQNQEEEMYWRLVTAAFSAMINALAGPAANFVLNGGKQ